MIFDDYNLEFESEKIWKEPYPDYFYSWDSVLSEGKSLPFRDPEQLKAIAEIYMQDNEFRKARKTLEYALEKYPEDEDLVYDIFVLLSDFEMWNDLLSLAESFRMDSIYWIDGHKLEALLHLGMEDEAFQFFGEIKKLYAKDKEGLSVLYRAMGEALIDVDLYEAAILVMQEAIDVFGENAEFLWLQMESHAALNQSDNVVRIGDKIASMAPFDAVGWYRMGLFYFEIKDYTKAIEAFEFASDLGFSDKKKVLFDLVKAYEHNGNLSKALEKTKDLLHLYPDSYFINLSAASLSAEMENWNEAIGFLDNIITEKPKIDALYLYKSSYYQNMGEYNKAKKTLQEGIASTEDPNNELKKQLDKLNEQYPDV